MNGAIIVLGIIVAIVAAFFVALRIGFRVTPTGKPTPDEARAKLDGAEDSARKETDTKIEEVRNATPDEKIRRARALIERGMRGK